MVTCNFDMKIGSQITPEKTSSGDSNIISKENLDSSNIAFRAFQDIMPAIARAHVESTIPLSLLQEFRSAERCGGIWKGEVIHTSLFKYWKGSHVEKQDRSSKVAQTIPALPNPITPLLRKGFQMNSLTSKDCVSI
jgi:hypothetical protein